MVVDRVSIRFYTGSHLGDMEDVGVTTGTTTLLLVVEDHSTLERHRDSECVVEIA